MGTEKLFTMLNNKNLRIATLMGMAGTLLMLLFNFLFWLLPYKGWLNGLNLFFCSLAFLVVVPFFVSIILLLKKDGLVWKPAAIAFSVQVLFWLAGVLLRVLQIILAAVDVNRSLLLTVGLLISICTFLSSIGAFLYWGAGFMSTREASGVFPRLQLLIVSCINLAAVIVVITFIKAWADFGFILNDCFDAHIGYGLLFDLFFTAPLTTRAAMWFLYSVVQLGLMWRFFVLLGHEDASLTNR